MPPGGSQEPSERSVGVVDSVTERARGPGGPPEVPGEAALAEDEAITPKERRYRTERDLRVDHILRRISNNGLQSLSTDELGFLDRASAEKRFELGWDERPPHFDEA